jgi:cytochrome c oxidase subunit 3
MSWANPGVDEDADYRFSKRPDKRITLILFLAVVSSMFLLFMVAYVERMELGDWVPVSEPGILWFNTVLLVLASVAMQWARNQAAAGRSPRNTLLLSGALALLFLAGQLVAWNMLAEQGYYNLTSPAYAFFLLLTALHGLHLLGGLWVWARTVGRGMQGAAPADLGPTIELCAVYWHYLLLVWVVLFVLMLTN